jgi:Leu/Phe-tRNA-protein transferase
LKSSASHALSRGKTTLFPVNEDRADSLRTGKITGIFLFLSTEPRDEWADIKRNIIQSCAYFRVAENVAKTIAPGPFPPSIRIDRITSKHISASVVAGLVPATPIIWLNTFSPGSPRRARR